MGVSLYFCHFLCPFLPFFPAGGKIVPKISKTTKEEMEWLTELVCENVPLYDRSSSEYSNVPFVSNIWKSISKKMGTISSTSSSLKQASNNGLKWTDAMTEGVKKKKGNAQPSVCINTTKNVRNSVCR